MRLIGLIGLFAVLTSRIQAFLTEEALHQIATVTCESIVDVLWRGAVPKNTVQQEYTAAKLYLLSFRCVGTKTCTPTRSL
jgi:hypothetical protein